MNILGFISSQLGIDEFTISKFVATAPYRYKSYEIPKRNGHGTRRIAQPSRELKAIQRLVLQQFLAELPVHEAATAYREGASIRKNAEAHRTSDYLLKMDFRNFFPSIKPDDLVQHAEAKLKIELSDPDKYCLTRLFFFANRRSTGLELSIGAPSSPFISNSILYQFDEMISKKCTTEDVTYTRYADDLTFSTRSRGLLFEYPEHVSSAITSLQYPRLAVNHDKTVFLSKKYNRHVTGLVLTNDGKLSIGREKKRMVKSLVHNFMTGTISAKRFLYLKGYLSFIADVEPTFLASLVRKYGAETINSIKQLPSL